MYKSNSITLDAVASIVYELKKIKKKKNFSVSRNS